MKVGIVGKIVIHVQDYFPLLCAGDGLKKSADIKTFPEEGIFSYTDVLRFMVKHSGPWVLVSGVVLGTLWKLLYGTWGVLDVLIVSCIILFRGIIEWLLHVYLHHARPLPFFRVRLKTPIYYMHIMHHKNPGDLESFLFKGRGLAVSILLALLLFFFVPISFSTELSFLIGFLAAVLIQEVFHVICHSQIQPDTDFMRRVVSLHRRHHEENASRNMGISSMLGDALFNTLETKR